jgi:hypothetical protein
MALITKKSDERITETLDYLTKTNVVRYGERQYVEKYVRSFLDAQFPGGWTGNNQFKAFSESMSMAGVTNPGGEEHRKMRRLLMLLWKAMGNDTIANAVPTLGAGTLAEQLRQTIRKAMLCGGKLAGDDWPARYVLTNIIARDPLEFLRRNAIIIRGSTRSSGLDQNLVPFEFGFDPLGDRFEFKAVAAAPTPGYHGFQPVSVPAVNWWDVPGRGNNLNAGSFAQIHGTKLAGAPIMVTTQFTGCSFCMKASGGHVWAAHVSPASVMSKDKAYKTDGLTLATQVCGDVATVAAGDFANAPGASPFRVYGRDKGNGSFPGGYPFTTSALIYACIIGFEENGAWQLFCQHTSATGVAKAVQIWPQ